MASSLQVTGVVAFYMCAALVMVIVNKVVLTAAPNLPVLFMLFQSLMTVILLHVSSWFSPTLIRLPSLELPIAIKLGPLIVVDAAGFVFNALCLRDVEAAFFQVARGLVLPLTILVSSMHTRTAPTFAVVACAIVVTAGFFLGVNPIANKDLPEHAVPTPLALFYGFLSSLCIAAHAVLVKSSLPLVEDSVTKLAYWQNFGSTVLLTVLSLFKGEILDFARMTTSGAWDWRVFAWGNLVTGIVGFLISVAGILSVKVTSPITHMFSSAARSVLQVVLGVRLFGDILTSQRAASIFTILVGTLLYTWVKHREMERKKAVNHGDVEAMKPLRDEGGSDVMFDADDDMDRNEKQHPN